MNPLTEWTLLLYGLLVDCIHKLYDLEYSYCISDLEPSYGIGTLYIVEFNCHGYVACRHIEFQVRTSLLEAYVREDGSARFLHIHLKALSSI